MNNKWVSFSPHILSKTSTTMIYISMLVLLCPIVACAIVMLGFNPLVLVLVSMLSCYATDIAFKYIVNKKYDYTDVSALFIGFIIGLAMPTGASWYVPILGSSFSMIFVRNISGGIGKNFVSEIAVAVLISNLVFSVECNLFLLRGGEVVAKSTLEGVMSGEVVGSEIVSLLFGGVAGTIAGISIFWLIIASVAMMVLRLIDIKVPLITIGSTLLFTSLFFDFTTAVGLTLTGGVILGAFFMATDYAVVPRNSIVRCVYAVVIGLLTALIWKYGNYQLAIYYAIVIAGLLSSIFNGFTNTFKLSKVR